MRGIGFHNLVDHLALLKMHALSLPDDQNIKKYYETLLGISIIHYKTFWTPSHLAQTLYDTSNPMVHNWTICLFAHPYIY